MYYPFSKTRGNLLQALITIACSSGFLLYGYDQGVFSGVIVTPYFITTFNNPDANLLGLVNAIYDIGGAAGAIWCFFFGNSLGRKRVIIIGCFVTIVGSILQGTSKSVAQLLVGRIVTGAGVGKLLATIGLWQAETSSAAHRGALMSIELSCCALGLFLSYWMNYGFGTNNTALAFQFPIFFQIFFMAATALLVPSLPESPRWLVTHGKMDKALASLIRLGAEGTTADSPEILQKMIEMEEMALLEDIDGWKWTKSLFHAGPLQTGKRVLMSMGVFSFAQLTGVNSVTYYIPTLLIQFIHVERAAALWIGGLLSVISVISSIIPIFIVDRVGRLPMLAGGAVAMAVCFFIVAGLYANIPPSDSPSATSFGIAIVSFIYIFFAFFSGTWLGPLFLYGAEILPLKGRAMGMGLGTVCSWLFNFMIVMVTPPALKHISWKFYVILGIFNVIIALAISFFYVETKGKSLEQIDMYFAERFHGGAELRFVEQEVTLRRRVGARISEDKPQDKMIEIQDMSERDI